VAVHLPFDAIHRFPPYEPDLVLLQCCGNRFLAGTATKTTSSSGRILRHQRRRDIDIFANVARLRLFRDVATVNIDLDYLEAILFRGRRPTTMPAALTCPRPGGGRSRRCDRLQYRRRPGGHDHRERKCRQRYEKRDPGPRATRRGRLSPYCASRLLRWIPDLVPLGFASLRLSGHQRR
jgi:hypothetical protein